MDAIAGGALTANYHWRVCSLHHVSRRTAVSRSGDFRGVLRGRQRNRTAEHSARMCAEQRPHDVASQRDARRGESRVVVAQCGSLVGSVHRPVAVSRRPSRRYLINTVRVHKVRFQPTKPKESTPFMQHTHRTE